MKRLLLAALTLIAMQLTACAAPSLHERLAGKVGDDRQQEAYEACLIEAHARFSTRPSAAAAQIRRMHDLCRAMRDIDLPTESQP